MNSIIINYNPFAMESQVYTLIDGKQEMIYLCSELKQLAEWLANYAYAKNIYNVKINAPFATVSELKRLISDSKINIEVM